jgi:DNA-binding transcriptional MerR regulator
VTEISIGEFARRSRLSLKALRLYDERGVLVPSRVDQASGYRYYDAAQVDQARLVVMLRQLQLPLAAIRELLACDPADARRELADYLVNRLRGKKSVMYEVAMREIPERSLLCLKRNVDEQGRWAFGKEFIAILRGHPLPKIAKIEGREGAAFCIWWGLVNDDSDGPIEWCQPVPCRASGISRVALSRAEPASRACAPGSVRRPTGWPGGRGGGALAARHGVTVGLGAGAGAAA